MIYLITYDLNKPSQEYKELYEELRKASTWWHYLDSTWLIVTSESVEIISQRIRDKTDNNDRFLVIDITGKNYDGWLAKEAWKWIYENINGY